MERSYRFSIGDSTKGSVGLCFDVVLDQDEKNEQEALDKVKEILDLEGFNLDLPPLKNVRLYLNADPITTDDIVLTDP